MPHGNFEFKGHGLSYFWLALWTMVITIITFGLFWPWGYSARQRWIAERYIDGKQLTLDPFPYFKY